MSELMAIGAIKVHGGKPEQMMAFFNFFDRLSGDQVAAGGAMTNGFGVR
jgi:hypothetical protein